MHLRGITALISSLAITYSFTTIPLAEAYSIAFLNPVFITLLSALILKEKVTVDRWFLVALSFAGVLVVVRPGFRELHWGHLTALASAFAGATSTTILRVVSGRESKLSIVAMNGAYQIIGAGILMAFTFVMLSPFQLFRLLCIGMLGGTAQLFIITALQRTAGQPDRAAAIFADHLGGDLRIDLLPGVPGWRRRDGVGGGGAGGARDNLRRRRPHPHRRPLERIPRPPRRPEIHRGRGTGDLAATHAATSWCDGSTTRFSEQAGA